MNILDIHQFVPTLLLLLQPYLKPLGEGVAKGIGSKTGEALFEAVKKQIAGKPEVEKALASLETKESQDVIETHFIAEAKADPAFAQLLSDFVKEMAQANQGATFNNSVEGNVEKIVQIGTVNGNVSL